MSSTRHDWTVSSLRARFMRAARKAGDKQMFDDLCQYQHFDATQIFDMADAACFLNYSLEGGARGEILIPSDLFLPAPLTWLEWYDQENNQSRALSCGEMEDGRISISHLHAAGRSYPLILEPGSSTMMVHRKLSENAAWWISSVAIELLAIINQPNLCNFEPREARWQRATAKGWVFGKVPTQWRRCTIRPGIHGKASELGRVGVMPLHFRRAHRMPKLEAKLGRPVIIRSRWKGDIRNGLVLKEYLTSDELAFARAKQLESVH